MDPVTVELTQAINHKGKDISSLTFREATAGDACVMDNVKGDMSQSLALLSSICTTEGVDLLFFKKLSLRETKRIIKLVGPLMGNEDGDEATG